MWQPTGFDERGAPLKGEQMCRMRTVMTTLKLNFCTDAEGETGAAEKAENDGEDEGSKKKGEKEKKPKAR